MSSSLQPEDPVVHPAYGRGCVKRLVQGGRYLLVQFEGQRVVIQVAPREVCRLGPRGRRQPAADGPDIQDRPALPPARLAVASLLAEGTTGDHQALQVLEALRVGVAPGHLVELYTVGRETEMALVEADLDQTLQSGAARVFLGDYGSGKTHVLDCIEDRALRRNFLVARVTLDGTEVAPSHPRRVYRALVQNLVYPERSDRPGLEPLLEAALEKAAERWLRRRSSRYHHYLSPALAHYRELRRNPQDRGLKDTLLDWLEGPPHGLQHRPGPRSAPGHGTPGTPPVRPAGPPDPGPPLCLSAGWPVGPGP